MSVAPARVTSAPVDRIRIAWKERSKLHEKQRRTVDAMYLGATMRVLAGGSGFGGKSHVQRACHPHFATKLASMGIFRVPTLMVSRDGPSLTDRMISKLSREWEGLGEIHTKHKEYGHCWMWHAKEMGPILLRNLQSGTGMEGKKGLEVGMATVDELTENLRDTYGSLGYVVRFPGVPWHPIVCGTNPDGIGHAWVKALWRPHLHRPGDGYGWEDEDSPRWKALDVRSDPTGKSDPRSYIYVPYLPDDNPNFDEAVFMMSIVDKAPHIQQARRYGKWDAPENARFDYVDPEEVGFSFATKFPAGVPLDWWLMVSCDWGLRNPFSAHWTLQDREGDYWTFRELYKTRVPTDAQIQMIRDNTGPRETVKRFVGDPAMWAHKTDGFGREEPSDADIYKKGIAGDKRFKCGFIEGARGSRVLKFSTLDKLLRRKNGYPDWHISTDCVELWGEITSAVYDHGTDRQNLSEELHPLCADHALTDMCYAFHGWLPAGVVEEKLGTEEEQLAAYMAARKAEAEKKFYRSQRRR